MGSHSNKLGQLKEDFASRSVYIFDLDGTLMEPEERISDNCIRSIRRLHDEGKVVILATGRGVDSAGKFAEEISAVDFLVCANGACSFTWPGKALLNSRFLDEPALRRVIAAASRRHVHALILYGVYDRFALKLDSDAVTQFSRTRILPVFLDDWSALAVPITKALAMGSESVISILRGELDVDQELNCSTSYPDYLEITHQGIDKGTAIDQIMTVISRTWRDVVVFGDGENDIGMFRKEALKVAMPDAHPNLTKRADYVLEGTRDALSYALQETPGYAPGES